MSWWNPFSLTGNDRMDSNAQGTSNGQQQTPAAPVVESRDNTTSALNAQRSRESPHQHTQGLQHPEIFSQSPLVSAAALTPMTFLTSLSPTIPMTSLALGFFSGFYMKSSKAGLVFMAENAHRRPETVQGWYFYNKTKNYKVLLSGLGGGISTGIRLAGWASVFVILDAACLETRLRLFAPQTRIDDDPDWHQTSAAASSRLLGHWSDGLVAGQGAALLASAAYRISPARFLFLGTMAGLATGGLQDLRDELRARTDSDLQ